MYFHNGSFLSVSKGRRGSWIWESLSRARDILPYVVLVLERPLPSIWTHGSTLFNLQAFYPLYNFSFVNELIDQDDKTWNSNLRGEFCFIVEIHEIKKMSMGPLDMEDLWALHYDKVENSLLDMLIMWLDSIKSPSPHS
ncbi:hypothetical protein LINPERHAP1_LOCUS22036 [Linum perenne]